MATPRDYYDILNVKRDASTDEIRSAYRKLARKYHPDVNKAADAAIKFNEVQQAYDALSDPAKRKSYDRWGHAGEPPTPGVGYAGGGPFRKGNYSWSNVAGRPSGPDGATSDFDASAIFEEMFGRQTDQGASPFGGFGQRAKARSRDTRGKDIEHEIVIDFVDAIKGGTKPIRISRGGATQTVEVSIPEGVSEGARLRMRGMGVPSPSGGAPGDLILTVHVAPHELFTRDGDDISLDLPLSIAEAALGATLRVPTLTGQADVTIPPGTSSGQRLRLRGQGVRHGEQSGDLYAIIKIIAPKDLSEADKAAIREIGSRLASPRKGASWS